jgi:hypothetical protein
LDLKPAGGHFGEGDGDSFDFFLTTGFLAGLAFLVAVTLGDGDLVAP